MKHVLGVIVLLACCPALALAQSADQEVVSALDSPDPVTPGAALSYLVTVRNNGPDPAVNGGVNINLPLAVSHTTDVVPAGWTCFWVGNNGTCNTPSFAAGVTAILTVNSTVNASLAAFPDQSITATFFPSGVTPDPNPGNNSKSATTTVDSPQVNLSVAASDSPDPVFPDGDITYTVAVANAGPDSASTVNFNVVPNSGLAFQSAAVPAGWSCTLPAVGALNATFTCSRATFAPGSSQFTVVFRANDEQFGINDGTIQTSFSVNSGSNETFNGDNSETESTAYVSPDADLAVTATDSPDPVVPDGLISYTVTVTNNGPDASGVTLNVPMNNTLKFSSITVPAGFSCNAPAPGAGTSFACTNPSLAISASAVFTVVLEADAAAFGITDQTITQAFTVNGPLSDPAFGNNSVNVNTSYVAPDADMFVTASDSPDPVLAGGAITFAGSVGNSGPDAASNVTLSVTLDANALFQSITPLAGFSCVTPAIGASGTVTCTAALLDSGLTRNFSVVVQANPALAGPGGVLQQQFNVSSQTFDPDGADNSVQVSTTYLVPAADLSVTKTTPTGAALPGDAVTYTLTLANPVGPDAAANVQIVDALPAALEFESITSPAGFSCTTPAVGSSGSVTCNAPSLAMGSTATFTLVARIAAAATGSVENSVVASSSTLDPASPNNTAVATVVVTAPVADLSISKSTAATSAVMGSTFAYTIVVANAGPQAAAAVVMTDVLPASLLFESIAAPAGFACTTPAAGTNGTVTCNAATLASGASATFTLTVRANAATGSVQNTASVASDTQDGSSGNNTGTSSGVNLLPVLADVSISKSTTATSALIGSTFAYTIVVSNAGPQAAAAVVMTDVLPASLLFESIAAPAGFTCTTPVAGSNGTVTCNAATLASGASATFTLTVRASAATGSVQNTASVASNTQDASAGNNTSTSSGVALLPLTADLSITKATGSTSAEFDSPMTYTIIAANAGPAPATNVVITDALPAGLALVSATPSQGTCSGTSTVVCAIGTLANGGTATITLVARVTATSGTIANSASVASSEFDPDAADASATTPALAVSGSTAVGIPVIPVPATNWIALLSMIAGLMLVTSLVTTRRGG